MFSYVEIVKVNMPEIKGSKDTNQKHTLNKLYKLHLQIVYSQFKSLVPNCMVNLNKQYKSQNNEFGEYSFSYGLL